MKKIFIFAALVFLSILAFAGEPGAKVNAAFQRQFPKITNVQWYNQGRSTIAYFSENGITYNLTYNSKGKLMSCIRYYSDHHLDNGLKKRVQAQYSDMTISGVTEITTGGLTVYEIHLENTTSLVTVRATKYGDLTEAARYERTK